MPAVVIENLSKVFRDPRGEAIRAVHSVSLSVDDGELLTLVGPSGCGKTTLLRLIAGLERVDGGTLWLAGRNATTIPPQERDIALVFQNGALYPHMTAGQNIAFPLQVRRVARAEARRRVRETAEWLGLSDCLTRRPAELSGGQRQRVALARALVRRPKLLLLDEPLSHLDAPLRAELRRELVRLHAQLGATFLHVTHDQDEAMALGQRVAVMNAGALQQVDRPLTVYRRPANLFVARFIGTPPINLLRGLIRRDGQGTFFQLHPAAGAGSHREPALRLTDEQAAHLRDFDGVEMVLGLRPEAVSLGSTNQADAPVTAVVEGIETLGHETRLQLSLAGSLWIASIRPAETPAVGQKLGLSLDLPTARFFDAATGEAIG